MSDAKSIQQSYARLEKKLNEAKTYIENRINTIQKEEREALEYGIDASSEELTNEELIEQGSEGQTFTSENVVQELRWVLEKLS